MLFARAELAASVKEIVGGGSNPRIEEYLRTCGIHGGDEVAWCSAYVNWCVEQTGLKGTDRGAARSWATWGVEAPKPPPFGAITVLWREKPQGPKGHVGFFVREELGQVWLLAGNQGNAVSIHAFPKLRVLEHGGYRVARTA
jgi:uncharacterized protein (TIGR02594 family)